MRKAIGLVAALVVVSIVAAVSYTTYTRDGGKNRQQPLLVWSIPDENLENFMNEAMKQGLLRVPTGMRDQSKLKELIENFGGWWKEIDNSNSFVASGVENTTVSETRVPQRSFWSVPIENEDVFGGRVEQEGLIIKHPDGAVEYKLHGREKEFKEIVENFGGEWAGDVRSFPMSWREPQGEEDEEVLRKARSKAETLKPDFNDSAFSEFQTSVSHLQTEIIEAQGEIICQALAYMQTQTYNYRGHYCYVNIPAEVDLKPWAHHVNFWNNHAVQSFFPTYRGIEAGVGWVAHEWGWTPGLYIYIAIDGTPELYKEIPSGISRQIFLEVLTYGDNKGLMYALDLYSGEEVYLYTTVTKLNSLVSVQQEAWTRDFPNWIDTSHHHTEIYPNWLESMGGGLIYWDIFVPTTWTNYDPLKLEYGFRGECYFIRTWNQFQNQFTLENLCTVSDNLYLWLGMGSELWLEFYRYRPEEPMVHKTPPIWSGVTPTEIAQTLTYNLGSPIEVVELYVDTPAGQTKLAEWYVTRVVLWGRLLEIHIRWVYATGAERSALWAEVANIHLQWIYAPQ